MAKHWIVCDLDGTLTDCSHRVHLMQAGEHDAFNAACNMDAIRPDVAAALEAFQQYDIMLLTGSPARYKKLRQDWLAFHNVRADMLLMRANDDFRPDAEVKISLLEQYFGNWQAVLNSVLLVLDDRDKVVEALRNYGLTVWQVRQGDY